MAGEVAKAGGQRPSEPASPPVCFPTSDGQINIAASGDHMFRRFCEAADAMALLDDPRLCERPGAFEKTGKAAQRTDRRESLERGPLPIGSS